MHNNWRPGRRDAAAIEYKLIQTFKCSTYLAVALIGVAVTFIQSASSQEHELLNTPPILVVPDRNWRISESETVGQIISRIRADDSENDELIFGLESQSAQTNVPFRIDPVGGVVYLNESLIGRGGENFFLYITVTDGQLKAKNEVFVNILPAKGGKYIGSRPPPSISNAIYNISHFLPSFDRLPGVQSVRNREPSRGSSLIFPPGFGQSYNPLQHAASWPTNHLTTNSEGQFNEYNTDLDDPNVLQSNASFPKAVPVNTNRTELTPIEFPTPATLPSLENVTTGSNRNYIGTVGSADGGTIPYNFSSHIILIVLICCAIFILAALIVGFWYRKRLCAIGKTLKNKSKEEMVKKSNQSNISSANLSHDSRNSMVLQHWNGPTAYGNRYIPWERDQQQQQQHQHQIWQTSIARILVAFGKCSHQIYNWITWTLTRSGTWYSSIYRTTKKLAVLSTSVEMKMLIYPTISTKPSVKNSILLILTDFKY